MNIYPNGTDNARLGGRWAPFEGILQLIFASILRLKFKGILYQFQREMELEAKELLNSCK
jgi:hypothetical protein